jgi:divalent metal cation (Fe/Co/Zn/Cd) transporter
MPEAASPEQADNHVHIHDCDDHGAGDAATTLRLAPGERSAALGRARLLNRVTLGWNVIEGVVAITAGVAAGSVSLIGFGMDSCIEVSASIVLAWRLGQERRAGCMAEYDRRAVRLIAVAFAALAAYVWVQAGYDLATGARPDASVPGLVMALLSFLVMPRLARAKRALAPTLGSQAVAADADQTNLCALLSGVLLTGVGLNAVFGWWWADPVAALVIGALAAAAARRSWSAESLADTCCP